MRTTLDLDGTVLKQLREHQRRTGKTLGQVASELLAQALAEVTEPSTDELLPWVSQPMGARVDLEDREVLAAVLDAGR